MTKKRVHITVDPEVHQKAEELGLNVSKVAENALRSVLHGLEEGAGDEVGPLASVSLLLSSAVRAKFR